MGHGLSSAGQVFAGIPIHYKTEWMEGSRKANAEHGVLGLSTFLESVSVRGLAVERSILF